MLVGSSVPNRLPVALHAHALPPFACFPFVALSFKHCFAKLWMSCIQKPLKLFFFMKSYSDDPRGSKTKQRCLVSCTNVSYKMAHRLLPLGSALRISVRISASILAFSMYRLMSRITLTATERSFRRSSNLVGVLRGNTIRGNTTRNSERKLAL